MQPAGDSVGKRCRNMCPQISEGQWTGCKPADTAVPLRWRLDRFDLQHYLPFAGGGATHRIWHARSHCSNIRELFLSFDAEGCLMLWPRHGFDKFFCSIQKLLNLVFQRFLSLSQAIYIYYYNQPSDFHLGYFKTIHEPSIPIIGIWRKSFRTCEIWLLKELWLCPSRRLYYGKLDRSLLPRI